jgi:hypothetical protein
MTTLSELNDRYEEILHSDLTDDQKDVKFASLMTLMEGLYKIPMVRNAEWEQKNKAVIALYRKISLSRDL